MSGPRETNRTDCEGCGKDLEQMADFDKTYISCHFDMCKKCFAEKLANDPTIMQNIIAYAKKNASDKEIMAEFIAIVDVYFTGMVY